ncbi:MAG: hypothetical protein GXY32_00505 [Ruminococcaceae bacterium]|nr:hypothetical protein [Oscillospiraceae bacterium]
MVREAAAILIVEALLLVTFWRRRYHSYAVAVLPLCIVPAVHLLINLILYATQGQFFGVRPATVIAFADVLALAVTCVVVVLISQRSGSKRNRRIYVITSLIYSFVLCWAFIFENVIKIMS